jgi:[acyl-carrier-protein] S-malonyltransferase
MTIGRRHSTFIIRHSLLSDDAMSSDAVKTAFLFPGQGAQTVGMGATVCSQAPAARKLFDDAATILGYDLYHLCTQGPATKLDATEHSQPAIFVASLAALEQLKHDAPEVVENCAATAGLSLGEYTALVFAGVMDFETGLRVVQERGRAMQAAAEATPSGMVSILGLEREKIELVLDESRGGEVLEIANLLCPGNMVVSGGKEACRAVIDAAVAAGAMKAIPLSVAGAFHTKLMQPAVDRLRAVLADARLQKPRIPVISNVDARPHDDPEEIRALLIRQVCSRVHWEDSMRYLLDKAEITQFYEIGPGRVLAGLLKRIARKTPCENIAA